MPRRNLDAPTTRTVARLYQRRRSLTLGLGVLERRAATYRATIAELEAELRTLGVEPALSVARPRQLPIRPKQFRWVVLRHLRASNAPIGSPELARRILAELGMDPPAGVFADVRQRVRDNLDALAKLGLARVVETGWRGAVWAASSPSVAEG